MRKVIQRDFLDPFLSTDCFSGFINFQDGNIVTTNLDKESTFEKKMSIREMAAGVPRLVSFGSLSLPVAVTCE